MQDSYRNIYYNARRTAGLTQERWAEVIGVSVEAVRQYETDRITPSDEIADRMADVAGVPALRYWHLQHKSRLADGILPTVEVLPLAQAVCQLLARMNDFQRRHQALLQIASDGRVEEMEKQIYGQTMDELGKVVQAAIQLIYAEGGRL